MAQFEFRYSFMKIDDHYSLLTKTLICMYTHIVSLIMYWARLLFSDRRVFNELLFLSISLSLSLYPSISLYFFSNLLFDLRWVYFFINISISIYTWYRIHRSLAKITEYYPDLREIFSSLKLIGKYMNCAYTRTFIEPVRYVYA